MDAILSSNQLKILLLILLSLHFVLERTLSWLNRKNQRPEVPAELEGKIDPEKYRLSQAYGRENAQLGQVSSSFSFILTFLVILLGGFGWVQNWVNGYFESTFMQVAGFFVVVMVVGDLLDIPFSLYGTFSIEERYGFNKMTIGTWIADKLKGYLLGAAISATLLWLFLYLVNWQPVHFWWMFWIVGVAFMMIMNVLYVPLILPLFNKLTPLEDGELKNSIEEYARKNGFPGTRIMVMDGSKRSTKANAFFSGMGRTKRVVLFDTLVEKFSRSELISILAHEVGHYRKRHVVQGLLLSIVQTGLMLFILSLFLQSSVLSESLGGNGKSIALNLFAFGLLYSPISLLTGILGNLLSRKNEYEADAFAKQTSDGKALGEALIRLHTETLSNLTPHPAYVFMHYSHPTLLQRLKALGV